MIVITGAAGFIGSALCRKLNAHGIQEIILVDDFTPEIKRKNWNTLACTDLIQREDFFKWAEKNGQHVDFIFHLGARTDYFATDDAVFDMLNIDFSQRLWSFAATKGVPFIYASSYLANPHYHLSAFAKSKLLFDQWIEKQQQHTPPLWAGLKLYQVYGKNEAHKGKNASNVYKIYGKYVENAAVVHVAENIIQDYIYINDVVKTLYYFLMHVPKSGIYETGTGFARPLHAIVDALNKAGKGEPKLILECRKESQNISQADLTALRKYAYKQPFLTLEEGVKRMLW